MKKILICNQKMYLTKDEAINLSYDYNAIDFSNVELIVCPNYLNFEYFSNYKLGAQNCFYEDKGSYTGEVSPYDLYLRGIKYAILGHSERRMYDTNEIINLKVKACVRNSIIPIICIGESKIEKELLKTSSVLKKQITTALAGVDLTDDYPVLIAYEPVYKIGSSSPLPKEEIEDTFKYIKKILDDMKIPNYKLLYGGSVKGENIKHILSDEIDGYLVGESCINASELNTIIKCIK